MKKIYLATAVAAAVLSLAACSGEITAAPSTGATSTTSVSSTTAPPVTTATSTAVVVETVTETAQPAAAADNRIGYGKLKMGMSEQEALATGTLAASGQGEGCKLFSLKDDPLNEYGVTISAKHGVAKIALPRHIKTSKGIGAGSTLADVKKAYPDVKPYRAGFSTLLNGEVGLAFVFDSGDQAAAGDKVIFVKMTGHASDCSMAEL